MRCDSDNYLFIIIMDSEFRFFFFLFICICVSANICYSQSHGLWATVQPWFIHLYFSIEIVKVTKLLARHCWMRIKCKTEYLSFMRIDGRWKCWINIGENPSQLNVFHSTIHIWKTDTVHRTAHPTNSILCRGMHLWNVCLLCVSTRRDRSRPRDRNEYN